MRETYKHGWYKVAFERDLQGELTPSAVHSERLVLIRTGNSIRAFDADCPHRGAHLAFGGRLLGDVIICPFHHYRIALAAESCSEFRIRERHCLAVGGMIFVRLSDSFDNGFATLINSIADSHSMVPGYSISVRAAAALLIENGFDQSHFRPIHHIDTDGFATHTDPSGALVLTGRLTPGSKKSEEDLSDIHFRDESESTRSAELPFTLTAFSPGLSVLQIGGVHPYVMVVGATPDPQGHCTLRVSLGLSREIYGDPPNKRTVTHLLENSRIGIQDDQVIWERISVSSQCKFTSADSAVLEFRRFCDAF